MLMVAHGLSNPEPRGLMRAYGMSTSEQGESPILYRQRWTPLRMSSLLVFNLSKDSLAIGYLVTFSNTFVLPSLSHLHHRSLQRSLATYCRSPRYTVALSAATAAPPAVATAAIVALSAATAAPPAVAIAAIVAFSAATAALPAVTTAAIVTFSAATDNFFGCNYSNSYYGNPG